MIAPAGLNISMTTNYGQLADGPTRRRQLADV